MLRTWNQSHAHFRASTIKSAPIPCLIVHNPLQYFAGSTNVVLLTIFECEKLSSSPFSYFFREPSSVLSCRIAPHPCLCFAVVVQRFCWFLTFVGQRFIPSSLVLIGTLSYFLVEPLIEARELTVSSLLCIRSSQFRNRKWISYERKVLNNLTRCGTV